MDAALIRIIRDALGVTAIEYALVAALISLLIVTGVTQVGSSVSTFFNNIASSF